MGERIKRSLPENATRSFESRMALFRLVAKSLETAGHGIATGATALADEVTGKQCSDLRRARKDQERRMHAAARGVDENARIISSDLALLQHIPDIIAGEVHRCKERRTERASGPRASTSGQPARSSTADRKGQTENTNDLKRCCVCLEADRQILFMPCKHVCCCQSCASSLETCPIC